MKRICRACADRPAATTGTVAGALSALLPLLGVPLGPVASAVLCLASAVAPKVAGWVAKKFEGGK